MASEAVSAQGVTLAMGDGATPETFTATVAEVKDINGPSESADQIECTHLGSTSKEYIAGLRDGGEVACEANAVVGDDQQQALYTAFTGGQKKNWVIDCPDGSSFAFAGMVTKYARKFGTNAVETVSFTIKISDAVTPSWPA